MSKSTALVRDLRDYATRKNLWWQNPLINTTDKGEVVLEWQKDDRNLKIYLNEKSIMFRATTAKNGTTGVINSLDSLYGVWKWLCNS